MVTKVLKMVELKYGYMNKKGQVEIVIGIVFIVGLITVGAFSSREVLTENRYIGDSSKNLSYDLSSCRVNIEEGNFVKFNNREEAISRGYTVVNCR